MELNFAVEFMGIGGQQVVLVKGVSEWVAVAPWDLDYVKDWDDFIHILEYQARKVIEDSRDVDTGVF